MAVDGLKAVLQDELFKGVVFKKGRNGTGHLFFAMVVPGIGNPDAAPGENKVLRGIHGADLTIHYKGHPITQIGGILDTASG